MKYGVEISALEIAKKKMGYISTLSAEVLLCSIDNRYQIW